MANASSLTSVSSMVSPAKPLLITHKPNLFLSGFRGTSSQKPSSSFQSLKVEATNSNKGTKPHSIVCSDCDGNGAILCTQCKGSGVNSVDHFNGQFKAGGLCWLCRGKRDILCGTCNGAGFLGGFMNAPDD
ncbi:putative Heat shock protein DnaJ, cysteine-rich domain superfamily [Dioscorea sansibarensis]